jgi:hypothetical protein
MTTFTPGLDGSKYRLRGVVSAIQRHVYEVPT